jgi:hypothetical protein
VTQPEDLERAHKHSSRHRSEIEGSSLSGCFYCLATFPPTEITEWTDWPDGTPDGEEDRFGQTALCPRCAIDSVPGSAAGYPLTPNFLEAMNVRWFQTFGQLPI